MNTVQLMKIILYICILSFSSVVNANWVLSNQESEIYFVSVKKSNVAEVHSFKDFTGNIDNEGHVKITIALDGVETLIPIRNERMRKMLFETAIYPNATITAKIDVNALDALTVGSVLVQNGDITLALHGRKTVLKAQLQAVMLAGNKLLVSTVKPVILNLGNYNLVEGVEALRKVAKLPSISIAVPGTVNLIFIRSGS